MDNLTHALAGMLLADVTVEALTPRGARVDARFRYRARWASAVAQNLPDLDFMLRRVTSGRVGYLLHHRGHSHTFGVGLLLGVLAFFGLRALFRRPSGVPQRRERLTLLGLCVAGPWLHIAADFSNNYGVHPFWPLYDGWLYGDAVFIVEPLFWVLSIPALALASEHRATRLFLGGIVVIGLALAWVTRFANPGTALFLTLVAAGFTAWNLRATQRTRTFVALFGSFAVALTFFVASAVARAEVARAVQTGARPGSAPLELVDTSLMPAPSNPFCWAAMSAGRRGDRYELLVATVALAPKLVPLDWCELEPTGHTLPLAVPSLEPTATVRWDGEWTAPLAELGALFRENCEARAYLRWARLPFWLERPAELWLGDVRYDREAGLDFAETVGTLPPVTCPKRVPPWTPPRLELIEAKEHP
jgi:inner membrane protein